MKPWPSISRTVLLSTGLLATFPVTCTNLLEKKNSAAGDEYEYVTVAGSNIPQKVKKGSKATTMAPSGEMSQADIEQLQRKTVSKPVGK